MIEVRIELFGNLRIRRDQQVITHFRTRKTGVLLAYLAHNRDRMHPREVLIELLWPGCEESRGRQSLSTALSALRSQIEPPGVPRGSILFADRFAVGLNPELVTTDVSEFEALIQRARQTLEKAESAALLAEAVPLYQGEFLSGYYEDWILLEQHRLANLFHETVRELITYFEEVGDLREALRFARIAAQISSPYEEIHYELMRLYVALGRLWDALRHYRALEEIVKQQEEEDAREMLPPHIQQFAAQIKEQIQEWELPPSDTTVPLIQGVSPSPMPRGTVTFMQTDVENLQTLEAQWCQPLGPILKKYRDIRNQAVLHWEGYTVHQTASAARIAFDRVSDAVACAVELQREVAAQLGSVSSDFRLQIALDTGEVDLEGASYRGEVLNHLSELERAVHGGQIVCTERTASLLDQTSEAQVRLVDLGIYRPSWNPHGERFFQVAYTDRATQEFPPLKMERAYQTHLPTPLTRFFGRSEEMERLEQLFSTEDLRLVTITGPAGSGKTRLALELARRLSATFRGMVWFVPLISVKHPSRIGDQILETLPFERIPGMEPAVQISPDRGKISTAARLVDPGQLRASPPWGTHGPAASS